MIIEKDEKCLDRVAFVDLKKVSSSSKTYPDLSINNVVYPSVKPQIITHSKVKTANSVVWFSFV